MKPNNNNKQPVRTKPVTKTIPFITSGKDRFGNDYDVESVSALMADLNTANVFSKLSIPASMSKATCLKKNEIKGVMNIARILSYDVESGNVDLLFFGKNVQFADLMEDVALVPHVRTARNSETVETITAFEIVPIMEA